MKAIIKIDVPDFQIGQEVNIHFKDSMVAKGIVEEEKVGHWIETDNYYQRWKCSVCGWHTRDAEPTYCPWCRSKNGKEFVSIRETREVGESE